MNAPLQPHVTPEEVAELRAQIASAIRFGTPTTPAFLRRIDAALEALFPPADKA